MQAEVPSNFVDVDSTILYSLNSADFTLAARAADAANSVFGQGVASARDASTISVNIPEAWSGDIVGFIAQLENLVLRVDEPGKIVINEKTGTVVLGGNVKVAQAVVARCTDGQSARSAAASTEDPAFDMGLPGAYSENLSRKGWPRLRRVCGRADPR